MRVGDAPDAPIVASEARLQDRSSELSLRIRVHTDEDRAKALCCASSTVPLTSDQLMGRHPSRTRQEVIDVALELVERLGLEALALRDLGAALGVGHTSVYTHFKDKQDLIDALVAYAADEVVTPSFPEGVGPRVRLRELAARSRSVFAKRPRLAPALLQASGRVHASHELSRAILTELTRAGLEGRRLLIAYRTLENYITGTSIFDFGGAPRHLSTRLARLQAIDPSSFESIGSEADVEALNEEAYKAGFDLLLDGFEIHDG